MTPLPVLRTRSMHQPVAVAAAADAPASAHVGQALA